MRTPRLLLALTVAVFAAGSLAGCTTSGSDASSGPVIAPVVIDVGDLQGSTQQLQVGQVLDIDTGDLAVDSYSGTVQDPSIAEFTAGREDGGATFNPGVTGLAEGSTQVTLANDDGGIQNVVFTVEVVGSEG